MICAHPTCTNTASGNSAYCSKSCRDKTYKLNKQQQKSQANSLLTHKPIFEPAQKDVQLDRLFREYRNFNPIYVRAAKEGARVVVLSDAQIPFEDQSLIGSTTGRVGLVEKFLLEYQPQYLLLNGDWLDCYTVSDFNKNPSRWFRLSDELALTRRNLKELRRILPNSEIFYIDGNHEERLWRTYVSICQKDARVSEMLESLEIADFTTRNLLKLEDLGMHWQPYGGHVDFLGFVVTHGDVVSNFSAYTARKNLDKWRSSGTNGHTHRLGEYHHCAANGVTHTWYESGCFLPGTWVRTDLGRDVKKIEDICVGDKVISMSSLHEPEPSNATVVGISKHNWDSDVYGIKVTGLPLTWATPNHPFHTLKGWKRADELTTDDFVYIPSDPYQEDSVTRSISETEAWLLGVYLAEGHVQRNSRNRIQLTFSLCDGESLVQEVRDVLSGLGLESSVYKSKNNRGVRVYVKKGKDLANKLEKWGGKYSHSKNISIMPSLTPKLASSVLQGWVAGDGHVRRNGNVLASTVSPVLAWQMHELGLRCKQRPNLSIELPPRPLGKHNKWKLSWPKTDRRSDKYEHFVKIKSIEKKHYKGVVHNLEIDSKTHTYTANGMVVHNCLCRTDPEYAHGVNWQNGFLYGQVHNNKFHVHTANIFDGILSIPGIGVFKKKRK